MERRERRVEEKDEERVKENEGQQKVRVQIPQPLSRFLVVKARALASSQGLTQRLVKPTSLHGDAITKRKRLMCHVTMKWHCRPDDFYRLSYLPSLNHNISL